MRSRLGRGARMTLRRAVAPVRRGRPARSWRTRSCRPRRGRQTQPRRRRPFPSRCGRSDSRPTGCIAEKASRPRGGGVTFSNPAARKAGCAPRRMAGKNRRDSEKPFAAARTHPRPMAVRLVGHLKPAARTAWREPTVPCRRAAGLQRLKRMPARILCDEYSVSTPSNSGSVVAKYTYRNPRPIVMESVGISYSMPTMPW